MAIKVVQNVDRISPTVSVAATSNPIALRAGYIRVSTGLTAAYVETGGNPIVSIDSFYIPPYNSEVLKERIARQRIAGITTGSSTIITFSNNSGNPFIVGDYVTIENAEPSGINTIHREVTATSDSTITILSDSSAVVGVITVTDAIVSRSVKVAALADGAATNVSITEIVQLVSE